MKIFKISLFMVLIILIYSYLFSKKSETIPIGSILDLTNVGHLYGKNIQDGLNLGVSYINKTGGINEQILRLLILDNECNPKKGLDNAQKLLDKKIPIIINSMNYLFLTEQKKDPLYLFPDSPPLELRKSYPNNVIYLFPFASEEAQVLLNHIVNKLNKTKIAIFYHKDDAYCNEAYKTIADSFKNKKINTKASFKGFSNPMSDTRNIKNIAAEITEFIPDCLIFCSYENPTQELIKNLSSMFLINKTFAAPSILNSYYILNFFKEKSLDLITTSFMPIIEKSNLEIIKTYKEESIKENKILNSTSAGAFFCILLFADICKKIKEEITKDTILEQIEKIKEYNFMGILLNYNKTTKKLSNTIWLNHEGKSEMIYIDKKNE